ncbi:MAG: RsmG family class I SAM-dependent methyltransferase [Thermodesulfobacteriota bacterium]
MSAPGGTPAPWRGLFPFPVPDSLPWQGLETYARELERWNRSLRLVGPRDLSGIRVQIADALCPFLLVPPAFPLLDIGSGAGLPAIPIALCFPGTPVFCLEPLAKRVSFLRHAARVLGLPALHVLAARMEDTSRHPQLLGSFATATARAVADPAALLAGARPFLRPDGQAFLLRGPEPPPEISGWELLRDLEYPPPPGVGPRRLAVYRLVP